MIVAMQFIKLFGTTTIQMNLVRRMYTFVIWSMVLSGLNTRRNQMRFIIKVIKDRKTVNIYKFDDYIDAMDMLDILERKSLKNGTYVEFRDMKPFCE